jgi:hypothetical protein
LGPEEKQKNIKKDETKPSGKLAELAMVRIVLIAHMMDCVNQGMEGKRSKSYQ